MWFIIALVVGVGLAWLILFMRGRDVKVTWYEWLIGIIGILLLLFTIQNAVTALAEWESTASMMFLLVFGLPALILLAVSWQLVARHNRAA